MTVERKVIAFEQAAVDASTGEGRGYGAVFNNRDDGGDIIAPGFFEPVLNDFLREGFISWGHDWQEPVAMPTAAAEDGIGLSIAWKFHSTEAAQEARTVTAERLDAGKSMGLSIGYEVAEEDMTPQGRILRKAARLFEVALVMVPMNRLATVTQVKTADAGSGDGTGTAASPESAPATGPSFADRLALATDEAKALVEIARNRRERRAKEGRVLSAANRERLSNLSDSLNAVLSDITELLRDTEPKSTPPAWALSARARLAQARAIYDIDLGGNN